MITYMAFKSKAPNAKAITEMICQIRYRTRTFISRMVALSSSMVFGDSFHCTPFSGFGYSFVGSRRNFPNPSTTKFAKDEGAHLALLPSVERNLVSRLKASSNSPGLAQDLINYKVKNVGKTDGGQDLFGEMKQRFLNFKEQKYIKELEHFQNLAEVQYPKFMVIACADSRVCPSNILGFEPGEAFMIRNVANLVPPLENGPSETNAALEFAVNTLEVGNILVIGHSSCAGIQTLMSMQDDVDSRSFLKKWVTNGKVAKLRTKADAAHFSFDQQCRHCEKESINRSLLNLLTYPWIQERVRKESLSIHGGYYDFLNCTFEKWTLDLKGSSTGEEGSCSVKDQAFWC
ncbi:beta carbonic anhydrase 5, chloroplastic-like isoform X1 [Corylus avellana]|uniref:beta carbonic anhydrase 5, chloroplastic-like isoform X1 n=2 Tax=Corylus avellana TaxID=13451 RepID=UPI00286BFCE2|nr:beta carbonic anhydrase 5, chloroplastic-like isoform X1 [Corylus avellana]